VRDVAGGVASLCLNVCDSIVRVSEVGLDMVDHEIGGRLNRRGGLVEILKLSP